MKKGLFKYCKDNLHKVGNGKLKNTPSVEYLHYEYGFGTLDSSFCYFNDQDKINLINRVQLEVGVHLFRDSYPEKQSRLAKANDSRDEKQNALKVSEDFVVLNSISGLCLNQQQFKVSPISSLGQIMCATDIISVEHKYIVLVENLIVMANLKRLNIPVALEHALWVYRGDVQAHQQTGAAYQFFRRFSKTHELICFCDLDPSGLQICLTSGATQWLNLSDAKQLNIKLQGVEKDWFNQGNALRYLEHCDALPASCNRSLAQMKATQTTLKQEHILEHSLKLILFPLNSSS